MTDIATLLERVRAATGPDREIDGMIEVEARRQQAYRVGLNDEQRAHWATTIEGVVYDNATRYNASPYTASVDAILALIERELPGCRWGVSCHSFRGDERYPDGKPKYVDGYRAHVTERSAMRPMPTIADHQATPALALCAAFLSAKAAA